MAYDLHIVRTRDWKEAANAPVTKQDVDALIAGDPELAWSTTDYVDMADEGGVPTRYFMITWHGQPCFWWHRDQILCSAPTEAQIRKLAQMSGALFARVVGDDGEFYPPEQPSAPTSQTPAVRTWKPWPLWKQVLAAFLLGCVLLALKLMIFGG